VPALAPLQPLQVEAGLPAAINATPLSIVNSARQQAADFCPLCEACAAGQCELGEVA